MADPLHVIQALRVVVESVFPSDVDSVVPTDDTGWGEPWNTLVGTPLDIAITLVLAVVVRWFLHRTIDKVARSSGQKRIERLALLQGRTGKLIATATGFDSDRHDQRLATIASLAKSAVTVIVFGTAVLTVLELLGLPLAPLLASASVGGLAVGFGAQSLVRDFLSGIFMIAEDQYGVGDVIDTGSVVGTVEEVSLRLTRLRDGDGTVWYVRNGEIQRIGNRSQGTSLAIVDVPVAFGEDLVRVTQILEEAVGHLDDPELAPDWGHLLVDAPVVGGIESWSGGSVTVRVTARCEPNQRDAVQREMRRRIREALATLGIAVVTPNAPPSI